MRVVVDGVGVANITRFIPTGSDPFAGSIVLSNWSRSGIYDIDFGGQAPSHFLTVGGGPLPRLGTVHEGFKNRGLIVDLELPTKVALRMLHQDGLHQLHRYRDGGQRSRFTWLN
jgi:hypothetical protein